MATLKNLVDETTNIKNELKTCHTNLKNNLIEKGVECSDDDKMASLIDKVENIKLNEQVELDISKENCLLTSQKNTNLPGFSVYGRKPAFSYLVTFEGSVYFEYQVKATSNEYWNYYTYVNVIDENETVIYTGEVFTIPENNTAVTRTVEFNNLKSGYIINAFAYATQGSASATIPSDAKTAYIGNFNIYGIVK